jgi:heparosan-N-sulfate-glucuronate 5-epimerase
MMKFTSGPKGRLRVRLLLLITIAALTLPLVSRTGQSAAFNEPEPRRVFPETGEAIHGRFLEYWETHGGLAHFGLPLSSEFLDDAGADGTQYRTQYFEQAVLRLSARTPGGEISAVPSSKEHYNEVVKQETWPSYSPRAEWQPLVSAALEEYKTQGESVRINLQVYYTNLQDYKYHSSGDFLDWGVIERPRNGPSVHLDADGIPMEKHDEIFPDETFYYSPGGVAQHCLKIHGWYLRGEDTPSGLRRCADKLVQLQSEDGAFRYPFSWPFYLTGEVFKPGWSSAFTQGIALSALARAYDVTGDRRYLEAGNKALHFLLTPKSEGGVRSDLSDLHPSLSNYVIFEEYVSTPDSYTLNGFMFALLGLYDWSQTPDKEASLAGSYFRKGIVTLRHILPYYDLGGLTSYHMGHVTHHKAPVSFARYHVLHVILLRALYSVTGEPQIEAIEKKWATYKLE